MNTSDLQVKQFSAALSGKNLDVVVSGSIGAAEAVRFIRSLRRLGANVCPWMSEGAFQFTTETAVSWAANQPVASKFSGVRSHIAEGDACVIAPASANFLHKIAAGITDDPVSALVTSYMGQKKPIIIVPNMHESLFAAPAVQENLAKVREWGILLAARKEEGKEKFPEPAVLADRVAHEINRRNRGVAIAMGSTKSYLDDVRYLSNYSSGALGTLTSSEAYRYGFATHIVCAASEIKPQSCSSLINVKTNNELFEATKELLAERADSLIMPASILDFEFSERQNGKISSASKSLNFSLKQTSKLLPQLTPSSGTKVGFKLLSDDTENYHELAQNFMARNNLSLLVINQIKDVNATEHKAHLFDKESSEIAASKQSCAQKICQHLRGESL